jgi:hypothetical protein
MSYVITHNGRVILGPYGEWKPNYMNAVIKRDTNQDVSIGKADVDNLPLDLGNGIIVRNAVEVHPEIDTRIQRFDGPFWTFTAGLGTATYTVVDKPLDQVRGEMKEKLAQRRYEKEIAGTKATIQGQEVTVETDRDTRNIFIQALMLMGDTDTRSWKFPKDGIWLTLNKADLTAIVTAGAAYIQTQFDWEESTGALIDTAVTAQDLLSLYPEVEPPATTEPELPV